MSDEGYREAGSSLFDRDLIDLMSWIALRQAQVLEADAYLQHVGRGQDKALESVAAAERTWGALYDLLAPIPELSILEAARSVARSGPLSEHVVESFWVKACDFYGGYPLVLCPEAIELVYRVQSRNLERQVVEAHERGEVARLEAPGWFWHDFPDPAWADAVRMLPREDARRFEETMKANLTEALRQPPLRVEGTVSATPSRLDDPVARDAVSRILSIKLPVPRSRPPRHVPVPLAGVS